MSLFDQIAKFFSQSGGGKCSLCDAPGVTRATCPLNPLAKNPNPEKHQAKGKKVAKRADVQPKKTTAAAKQAATKQAAETRAARGCAKQTDSKYASRPSPPFPANNCCGEQKVGNDGNMYESRADKRGVCKWYLVK